LQEENKINTKINFGSDSFKKYFANTSWLFAEKIIRLLLAFVVSVLTIKYLGPEQFGILTYSLSFVGLFSTLAVLGLDSIIVRELVKNPEKKDILLGSVFLLRLAGAVLTISLISIGVLLTGDDPFTTILIFIIASSTFFQSFSVIEYYFHSRVEAKYPVIVQFVTVVITSIIKLAFIYYEFPLIYFAVIFSVEFLMLAAGYLIVYKNKGLKIWNWKFNKNLAVSLLSDSWPLILSGLVIAVYMKIDQVMIKNMLTETDVGYYGTAVRLAEAWYFIPVILTSSLFPAIINAKKANEELYLSRLQKLYDILAWLAIGIAIPVTFLSEFIIVDLIFGEEFLPAASVLTIYIWAGVAVFLGVASSQYLIAENLTKLSFIRTLLGMIANVLLNLWLIPIYGITGSAVATLISYSVATFSIGLSRKTGYQFIMMFKSIFLINLFKIIFNYGSNINRKN
jgi:O-antigen/teichoic acid export membrane protein